MNVNILLYDDFDIMHLAGPAWVFGSFQKKQKKKREMDLVINMFIK